jgi:putative glutamine amidotransferase
VNGNQAPRQGAARRPVVGIPIGHAYDDPTQCRIPTTYSRAIESAGGLPLLLPSSEDQDLIRELLEHLDGLLLAGGGDVAAEHYGAADSGKLTFVDPSRDRFEIGLTRRALAADKPVLGICRGIQVLNVAAGGTLVQDIPFEKPGALFHRTPSIVPPSTLAHAVHVRAGSLLAGCLGLAADKPHDIPVNSTHHQAVDDVAPGYCVCATSPDGVVEGIESPSARFALGVQWHPERLVPRHETMVALFRAFVRACCLQCTISPTLLKW